MWIVLSAITTEMKFDVKTDLFVQLFVQREIKEPKKEDQIIHFWNDSYSYKPVC